MKFFALLLISVVAVCYAAEEADKPSNFLGGLKDSVSSLSKQLPWNKAAANIAEETKQLALKTADSCKAKTGLSDETIEGLKNGDFKKQKVEENTKVFIACYLEGLGFLENGKPRVDVIAKRLGAIVGPTKLVGTLLKCGGVGGANDLDKTMNTYTCFFDNKAVVLE